MNPQRLLTVLAILVVLLVLFLYLRSPDESFLDPENTGPPEVTRAYENPDSPFWRGQRHA